MPGIYFHKRLKKWQASVRFGGRAYHVGSFETEPEAEEAQDKAKKELVAAGLMEPDKRKTALEALLCDVVEDGYEAEEINEDNELQRQIDEIVGDVKEETEETEKTGESE